MATSRPTGDDAAQPADRSVAVVRPTHTPRYLQLDRKELRIRGDQADSLSTLTRQLNRARARTGERITDNTLIRVAIDLLLAKQEQLEGTTEEELRYSVSPELKERQ